MVIKPNLFPLKGVVDIHNEATDFNTILAAVDAGLKAVVLKWPGGGDSTIAAKFANSYFGKKTKFFGGVVLDNAVGGLNPYAVNSCAKNGGKFVWLPVQDAKHHRFWGGTDDHDAVLVIDSNGDLLPEVYEILQVVADNKMILGTGHLSGHEVNEIVKVASQYEISKIILNHPLLLGTNDDYLEKIIRPGVYIEHCYVPNHPKYFDVKLIIDSINRFGFEHSLIGDFGTYFDDPNIADALVAFGMSYADVRKLTLDTPLKIMENLF